MIDSLATIRGLPQTINRPPLCQISPRVMGKPQRAAVCAKKGNNMNAIDTLNTAEEWRPVVGFEGFYEVSNLGQVRRSPTAPNVAARDTRGRVLTPDRSHPYARVSLHMNGRCHRSLVHRLVAAAFMQPFIQKSHINHIDGNKRNNTLANLEWSTPAENTRHAWRTGLCKPVAGERHGCAKLSTRDVTAIRKARSRGVLLKEIANVFNVTEATISGIARGQTWKSVE